MTIRSKISLILLAVVAVFALLAIGLHRWAILPSFQRLEREQAVRNLNRCVEALQADVAYLERYAVGWSEWDDLYEFVETRSEAFIEANLQTELYQEPFVDLIALFDREGIRVWEELYDKRGERVVSRAFLPEPRDEPDHPLYALEEDLSRVSGLILTPGGPLMATAQRILHSDASGPHRGTIVMARFLTDVETQTLAARTSVRFDLVPLDGRPLSPEAEAAVDGLAAGHSPHFLWMGPDTLLVSTMIPDLRGQPALLLTARLPREVMDVGKRLIWLSNLLVVAAGVLTVLITSIVLRRAVASPLARLTAHTREVGTSGDLSRRLGLTSSDEIGELGEAFDRMLADLEAAEERLRLREKAVAASPAGLVILERRGEENVILQVNPAFERITGIPAGEAEGRDVLALLGPALDGTAQEEIELSLTQAKRAEVLARLHRPEGGVRWCELLLTPIARGHAQVSHLLAVLSDVTDLRDAERQTLEAPVSEQRRIGQELHDGPCQRLTAVALLVDSLRRQIAARGAPEAGEIGKAGEMIAAALREIRALARGLSPVELDARGICAALNELGEMTRQASGLRCDVVCDEDSALDDSQAALHVLRIAQEAVNNAVRHAHATRIEISLAARAGTVTLTVRDNGKGIDGDTAPTAGLGLRTMTHRARLLGGNLAVRPAPGGGTLLVCTFRQAGTAPSEETP